VIGASVVAMAVLALPVMLKYGYSAPLAAGTVTASGTLGQIIPPSIVLIILGDQMGVNVGDLFLGALIPGLLLSGLYVLWITVVAWLRPSAAPALPLDDPEFNIERLGKAVALGLLPPLALVAAVLGTIFFGIATPTEAGAMGAFGAILLALLKRRLNLSTLRESADTSVRMTAMVFTILIGATAFATVFSALGGTWLIEDLLTGLPGGPVGFLVFVMLAVFLLGFFLDFIEITFIVVPLITPVAISMGLDPLWLGILIAMNLQASFLTPPFGFALFYLRGAAPDTVRTIDIYRGVVPFIGIQLFALLIVALFPGLVTWLPSVAAN
jgi:tripartite ATP-independent transporter DctM subunit